MVVAAAVESCRMTASRYHHDRTSYHSELYVSELKSFDFAVIEIIQNNKYGNDSFIAIFLLFFCYKNELLEYLELVICSNIAVTYT